MTDLPGDESLDAPIAEGDLEWLTDAPEDQLEQAAERAAAQELLAEEFPEEPVELLPVVAVVGRPNVGKSTLVNRILGHREAVVEDVPGVTRDRVTYRATWSGRDFMLLDTGGWDKDAIGRAASVSEQAERAMREADVVMFVVDATVGPTAADEQVVPLLRAADKPVALVANKVDNAAAEAEASSLWALGLGEPYPVSALHGRGSGDLLDTVLGRLPEHGQPVPDPGFDESP